jgi:MerR family copper efflux transcriptional regulator
MKEMTVGKLAKTAGVNIETVRYYEQRGLLPKPSRKESGYRLYSQEDVRRLRFILRAKELGFSLREIQELLELRVDAKTNCDGVREQAEGKISDIEQKIADLERMREVLVKLATACRNRGATDACPVLEALENKNSGS